MHALVRNAASRQMTGMSVFSVMPAPASGLFDWRGAAARAGIALLLAGFAPSAFAQEAGGDGVSIGTGIITVPSYEGSDTNILLPELVVRGQVDGFSFFSRGPVLFIDGIRDAKPGPGWDVGLGPVAGLRLDRVARIEDRQVRALGKRDVAVELGGWVGVTRTGVLTSDFDLLSFRVSVAADVAGAHGSYVVVPTVEYGTPVSRRAFVGVSVLTEYVGGGFGDYYFNIDSAGSAASGLSAYDGAGSGFKRAGVNLVFSRALTGDLTEGLSAIALVGYYRMLGEFARSPVVREAGDADQLIGGLGLTYTF